MTKLLQDIHLDHYWIPRSSDTGLGLNDSEIAATFAFPFLYNEQTPLLVTPGFGYQAWDGPRAPHPDMPPNTYEAFLELGWNPQATPWLSGELAFGAGTGDLRKQSPFRTARLAGQAANYTLNELRAARHYLMEMRERMVSTALDGGFLLETTLLRIVGPPRRARQAAPR